MILLTAFDEALQVVDGLRLSAEHHFDHAIRVELDDHSGTLVNHPHVVVLIDADGVRERRGVVIRAPQLDEFQVFVELEQFRGRPATRELPPLPVREYTNRWPFEFLETPSVSPIVWPGTTRGSTSSVICNFGVAASRASCFALAACLSGLGGPNWAWTCSVPHAHHDAKYEQRKQHRGTFHVVNLLSEMDVQPGHARTVLT